MVSAKTPEAEYEINSKLVLHLLKSQHPDLAGLPISNLDEGWDNRMFRLGSEYLIRLPRRILSAGLIENEQKWLPQLAQALPLPISSPVRFGTPEFGYPCSWSILPWIEGSCADVCEPQLDHVESFVSFLKALHVPAPLDAPSNPYRGIDLKKKAKDFQKWMSQLTEYYPDLISPVTEIWEQALQSSIDVEDTWIHGDLHAKNVLVSASKIAGVIDWGDLTSGDRATDLASIWMLFPEMEARQTAIELYGPISRSTLQRAQGWAALFGVLLLYTGLTDNPRHKRMGEQTLSRVIADSAITL